MNKIIDLPSLLKNKREGMGLTQSQFAEFIGLNKNGERTISGWERGEHIPSISKYNLIANLPDLTPFKNKSPENCTFRFIDLFAGIGGIRLPFQEIGGHSVFSSEWDKYSQKTYAANFGELPSGDITKISSKTIPKHDVLLAGFPCQAFSQAGLRKGFYDTRGTMFFEIQRILGEHQPSVFLLENVKQLKGHDKGKTLKTIIDILTGRSSQTFPEDIPVSDEVRSTETKKLNYWVDYKVLSGKDFGTPQKRERIFIIGFNKDYFEEKDIINSFMWPTQFIEETKVSDILENQSSIDPKYTISEKLLAGHERRKLEHIKKGNGFGYSIFKPTDKYTNTLSARYYKDGSEILIDQSHLGLRPRKLTPRECANLQGFPKEFLLNSVSDVQAYKQLGNSVCVKVVRAVAKELMRSYFELKSKK